MNTAGYHYVDIKRFFDNVNHTKLLNQLYAIGIKDRQGLAIIGKMLKAPIDGIGIQHKECPMNEKYKGLLKLTGKQF